MTHTISSNFTADTPVTTGIQVAGADS
jgi:hypothetical protein